MFVIRILSCHDPGIWRQFKAIIFVILQYFITALNYRQLFVSTLCLNKYFTQISNKQDGKESVNARETTERWQKWIKHARLIQHPSNKAKFIGCINLYRLWSAGGRIQQVYLTFHLLESCLYFVHQINKLVGI